MVAITPSDAPVADDVRRGRRRAQTEAWRRRSQLIHRLRRILPASIAAIVLILAGWVLIKGLVSGLGDGRSGGQAIHMTNAHFLGRDGDGRAYTLSAVEASRVSGDIGRVSLIKPTLIFNADGLKPTKVVADRGLYREDNRMLLLQGHVVATDGADSFHTSQAVADTAHLMINGWNRVEGTGPTGTITADSFGIYNHGETVVFSGHVHSILKRD